MIRDKPPSDQGASGEVQPESHSAVEWKALFEDLRTRRPELVERLCRNLLVALERAGHGALPGPTGRDPADRQVEASWAEDPNRPANHMVPGALRALYESAIELAGQCLAPDEISRIILLTEKQQLALEVGRVAEDSDTSLPLLRDRINAYLGFHPDEAVLPRETLVGIRAALVRRLLVDESRFVARARRYITIRELGGVIDHILPTGRRQCRLGGKASGLLLARSILSEAAAAGVDLGPVAMPESYFLPANGIFEFIEHNGLEEMINIKYRPLEEVRREYPLVQRVFTSGEFPHPIHRGLRCFLEEIGEGPLVVRSSSLLEDRSGHAFSGKYKSLFIGNLGPLEERLGELEGAIAEIYASVFGPDPIEYRREHDLLDFREQMAILIQRVVGRAWDGLHLPVFAGVAHSRCEMRWSSRIRRSDGVARMVVGLGTRAVDRTGNDYPVLIALGQPMLRACQQPEEVYRYSQRMVDLVDLRRRRFDTLSLEELVLRLGPGFPLRGQLLAAYRDGQLVPLASPVSTFLPEELVVTFDGLLRSPFPRQLKSALDALEEAFGEPVDVEFAHDGDTLFVLQCRPLALAAGTARVEVPADLDPADVVFTANRFVQTGQLEDIEYLVLIDPRDYELLPSEAAMRRVASCVSALNGVLPPRRFILLGPGRWGSRGDIRLGVPVGYSDISHTAMLVEIARRKGSYRPEVSFGTHFFQDLVESRIVYLPLYPDEAGMEWNEKLLRGSPNVLARLLPGYRDLEETVRVVHLPEVTSGRYLQVVMDGEAERAAAFLAPATRES